MDIKNTICIFGYIGIFMVLAISNLLYAYRYLYSDTWLLYSGVFVAAGMFFCSAMIVREWIKLEKGRKIGEDLFLSQFGVRPDEVKVLSAFTYKYDRLTHGISTHSVRIKFQSQGKVYKAIVDIENKKLYIKEPVFLPVHTADVIPVWKDVTRIHRNGMAKTVVFYDADERPRGENHLDEEGNLRKGSWRRYKGTEVYWFPKKQVWEP